MFLHLEFITTSLYCFQLAMISIFLPLPGNFHLDSLAMALSSILTEIAY